MVKIAGRHRARFTVHRRGSGPRRRGRAAEGGNRCTKPIYVTCASRRTRVHAQAVHDGATKPHRVGALRAPAALPASSLSSIASSTRRSHRHRGRQLPPRGSQGAHRRSLEASNQATASVLIFAILFTGELHPVPINSWRVWQVRRHCGVRGCERRCRWRRQSVAPCWRYCCCWGRRR
jgi:hypothetical protein